METLPPLHALLGFGLPANRLEMLDGRVPCVWPCASAERATATFEGWVSALARWLDVRAARVDGPDARCATVGDWALECRGRWVDARVPVDPAAFREFAGNAWRAGLWLGGADGTPWAAGAARGALHSTLAGVPDRLVVSGCDVVLDAHTVVAPACAVLRRDAVTWIGGAGVGYPCGVPELIVEIASPATLIDDTPPNGRRARRLAEAGVPRYWLVDLCGGAVAAFGNEGGFRLETIVRAGNCLRVGGCDVAVADLLPDEIGPSPHALAPPPALDPPAGIQHLLLCGHPLRRHEVLDGRAGAVVAFRDAATAARHFVRWCRDAARLAEVTWRPPASDTFEAGPWRLWRDDVRVHGEFDWPVDAHVALLECAATAP